MVAIAVMFIVLPVFVTAAGLVPCGGTGEPQCQACDVTKLINNVVAWLVIILSIVASILIVIAGFKLVTSGGNPAAKTAAKETFINIFIGFLIILASWLLVDTVMKALVNQQAYGMWNEIQCVSQPPVVRNVRTADELSQVYGTVDPATARPVFAAGDCSPANLMSSAGMNLQQADTFSCIARAESNCNLTAQNERSTARGVFQITRGWNTPCHNLNVPQCSAAVGASGPLNCSEAFRDSRIRPGYETQAQQCNAAADNFSCNAAAALCLYNQRGGYNDWLGTAAQPHSAQRACVARYAQ